MLGSPRSHIHTQNRGAVTAVAVKLSLGRWCLSSTTTRGVVTRHLELVHGHRDVVGVLDTDVGQACVDDGERRSSRGGRWGRCGWCGWCSLFGLVRVVRVVRVVWLVLQVRLARLVRLVRLMRVVRLVRLVRLVWSVRWGPPLHRAAAAGVATKNTLSRGSITK